MDEEGNNDREWWDYESGPFCRHWGDLGMCEEPCPSCAHPCHNHPHDTPPLSHCTVDGCACEGWPPATTS